MVDGTASWHFFDVESGILPEECSSAVLPGGGEGRIVAMAATLFACANDWASRAVVSIARAWAEEGRRIFLMDLGLENPSLHEVLGLSNVEGVSDAFLYGASVQHIAQSALDGAFYFASAGTLTVAPEEVLTHPRWNDLAEGFSEADATLILFIPTQVTGADRILSLATDLVCLGGQGESLEAHLGPAAIKTVTMLGPLGGPPELTLEAVSREQAQPQEPVPEWDMDLEDRFGLAREFTSEEPDSSAEGDAAEIPPAASGAASPLELTDREDGLEGTGSSDFGLLVPDFEAEFADLPPLEETGSEGEKDGLHGEDLVRGPELGESAEASLEEGPAPVPETELAEAGQPEATIRGTTRQPLSAERARPAPRRRSPPKRRRPVRLLAGVGALVVVIAVLAVGSALGVIHVPGLSFLEGGLGEIPDPPLTLAGPQPNEPVLQYSLELIRYENDELDLAVEMLTALRARLPGLLFALVPEQTGDETAWAVLAGPATDFVELENLKGPLGETLTREDPDTWPVRETPRAFYLGERETLAEAQEYASSVEGEGVYPYILYVTYPNDTEAYEILAGAYRGVADARPLQMILRREGFRGAPLIERRGRLPG